MGRKLRYYIFSIILSLISTIGFAQCPTSVGISTDPGNEICEGTPVTFTATINGGSARAYHWEVEGVNQNNNSSEFTTNDLSDGDVIRVVVNTDECEDIEDTFQMTVNQVRTGSATITANNTNICPGETVNFSISSSSNVSSSSEYEWRVNGNAAGTNSSFSSDDLSQNDEVQLYIASGVPCVEPFLTNTITISEKPGTPAQPGSITTPGLVCPGISEEYSITAVSGADEYIWTLPNGDKQTTSNPSLNFSIDSAGEHSLSVQASNECGTSTESTTTVSVNAGTPSQPGGISAPDTICPGAEYNYSIAAVDGANQYLWTINNGTPQSTTQPSIDLIFNSPGNQNISVQAENDCGTSSKENLTVTVNPDAPDTPENIQGNSEICPGEEITYSVDYDNSVTEYQWDKPTGWTVISTNGNKFTVEAGDYNQNGDISVIAVNECGENEAQTLAVEVLPGAPDQPVISGDNNACTDTEEIYSIDAIDFAEEYTWEFPSGWNVNNSGLNTVTVGAGTTSVSVILGSISGTASVIASNSCGNSTEGTITLNIEDPAPDQPGEVTFPNPDNENNVCQGATGTYSIAPVTRATSYLWTLPDNSTQTTTNPELEYTATNSGTLNLSVQAVNNCGASASRDFQIEVTNGEPGNLGEILSNIDDNPNICPPAEGITFEVDNNQDADNYIWDLPTGWEITHGENTSKITVTITATASYGSESVSVYAQNICGDSEVSILSGLTTANNVVTNIGDDQIVCSIVGYEVDLYGEFSFGNGNLDASLDKNGSGNFTNVVKNKNDISATYTVTQNDISSGQVTITLKVPQPTGGGPNKACGDGIDEMTIYFLDDPTAEIFGTTDICTGIASDLTFTGTPNTTVTYTVNGGNNQEIALGNSGEAIIDSGNLTETTTYSLESVRYSEDPSCSANLSSSATITVTPIPTATISYSRPYCTSMEETTGGAILEGENAYTGGTFTATGDLNNKIDAETGAFIPADVDSGEYTVTYTTSTSEVCDPVETTTTVVITAFPTAEISYENSPFCFTDESAQVLLSGTGTYENGEFTSTTGLDIDPENGNINPAGSTPGTYTVTYTTPENEACEEVIATSEITITEVPVPEISYTLNEICKADTATYQADISGLGEVNGGSFSAPSGLSISNDGIITPGSSDPGTYTITYSLDTSGDGCEEVTAETEITITEVPTVNISYAGPFCKSTTGEKAVSFNEETGAYENGIFSVSPAALVINEETGAITPSNSEPGDYTITYTIPESGGCEEQIAETTVTITAVPGATISYTNAPFCNSDSNSYAPEFTEISGDYENGGFSGTSGLEIDSEGNIIPSESTAGTHTITYSISTINGCEPVTITLDIEIYEEIVITSQPFNIGLCSGESAVLEVAATGDALTYQWFDNNGAIDGATSASYEISPAAAEDTGTYYVEVYGAGPCSTVISDEVTLNVNENIIVTTEPQDLDLCIGDEAVFEIAATASGGDVIYQWLKDGAELAGKNGETLTISNLTADDAGKYSVYIEGPAGYSCATITSAAGTLSLSEPPVAIAGEDMLTCYTSEAINITTGASAENFSSMEWTHNGSGTLSNAETIDQATYSAGENESGIITLTLTVYGNATCAEVFTEKTLEIEPIPVISSFSYTANEFCETDTEIKSPVITGENAFEDGLFIVEPETGLSIASDGKIDPSASEPGTYLITYSTPEDGICDPVLSDPVTIVIGENPIADFEYDSTVYCKDTQDQDQNTNPVLSFTEEHPDAQIFTADNTGLSLDPNTGAIDLFNSDSGVYIITRTINYTEESEDGCTEVSTSFEITINDKPIADFEYEAIEFCADPEFPVNIFPSVLGNSVLGDFSFTAIPEDANLAINAETGEIDVTNSDEGTFTVINTVDNKEELEDNCEAVSEDFIININKKSNAEFSYTKDAYCITDELAAVISEGFESGGSFASENNTLDSYLDTETGAINWDFEDDIAGIHTIIYTIPGEGVCETVAHSVTIEIDPVPEGGELNFEGYDRIFTICENVDSNYAVPLQLSNNIGTVVAWKYRASSAISWSTVMENGDNYTEATLSTNQIEAININETTIFRVEIDGGACMTNVFSKTAIISVIPSDIKPTPVEVDPEIVCIGEEVTLSSGTGYENSTDFSGGAFDNSSITNHGWRITDQHGNTEFNFNSSANNTRPEKWLRTNPQSFITANINTNIVSEQEWSSGATENKGFAIVSGDNPSTLETPVFNLSPTDQAILSFDQAYNLTEGAEIRVEISTNGGNSYDEEINPLYHKTGPLSSGSYGSFGTSTHPNNNISIDLGNYMGQGNLRIRFKYIGVRDGDIWTLDNIDLPDAPRNIEMEWRDYSNPDKPEGEIIGYDASEVWEPKQIGWNSFEVKTRLIFNSEGEACEVAENSETIEVFVFDTYTVTTTAIAGSCGNNSAKLSASVTGSLLGEIENYPTPDGYIGEWQIEGPAGYELANLDTSVTIDPVNNPDVIFTAEESGPYTFAWVLTPTEVDENGDLISNENCEITYNNASVEILDCTTLDFDGLDDYVDLGKDYPGDYSIEAWIRPEASTGTIISGPNFDINMEDLPEGINSNSRWYHIAVSNGKIFVDGIDMGDFSLNNTGTKTLIGARWNSETQEAENHFSGWIEEVRLWNGTISENQIRFLMNQRLQDADNIGVEIPMPAPGLNYGALAGYYQLITTDILEGGLTADLANNSIDGKLRNMETLQENTAPLPYTSGIDGQTWATDDTWTHFDVWDAPNSNGINDSPIEWNIARTSHNIDSGNKNITVLGLKSEAGTLDIFNPSGTHNETNSGQYLRVSHYLKLDGIIDLTGESQLIQDVESVVDAASAGYLERDQQGTANSYNYNYWSFPVSEGASNAGGSIRNLLRDGTNSNNPAEILYNRDHTYADNYNYAEQKRISSYWLFKFFGTANLYAEWKWVGENGHLNSGDGFTMKGTSGDVAISTPQNYVFRGLPNNGPVTGVSIGSNQNRLIGNPYPSALEAKQFILDNLKSGDVTGATNTQNIFNGALYFWDHFGPENTHILREYIGGYATINLSGTVASASSIDERINNDGSEGSKKPGLFVPVGQGFFINTVLGPEIDNGITIDGGTVNFNNSQRAFVTEINSDDSQFLKPIYPTKKKNKVTTKDSRYKIRLDFTSPLGFHRQILVTADANTSNGFDLGYDALLIDDIPEDMFWLIQDNEFVIQAVPNFNIDQVLPLGIKIKEAGEFRIELGDLENYPETQPVYLKDKLTDSIHDLRKSAYFEVSESGTHKDRFEIVFKNKENIEDPDKPSLTTTLDFGYNHNTRELRIDNPDFIDISEVLLFDLGGRLIQSYTKIPNQKQYTINIRPMHTSVYIVKLITENGNEDKKFIME